MKEGMHACIDTSSADYMFKYLNVGMEKESTDRGGGKIWDTD